MIPRDPAMIERAVRDALDSTALTPIIQPGTLSAELPPVWIDNAADFVAKDIVRLTGVPGRQVTYLKVADSDAPEPNPFVRYVVDPIFSPARFRKAHRLAYRSLEDSFKPVIMESPYAGTSRWRIVRMFQRWRNVRYARECLRDSLDQGEAPIASHLLYTQALNDRNTDDRMLGIKAGLAWGRHATATVVYEDFGVSVGMEYGIQRAIAEGRPVIRRKIGTIGKA